MDPNTSKDRLPDNVINDLRHVGDGYSGAGDLESLIINGVVQENLGMSEDQKNSAASISKHYRSALQSYYSDFQGREPSERSQLRSQQVAAERSDTEQKIRTVLTDAQWERLKQISWRVRDGNALLDQEVVDALALTPKQKEQLAKVLEQNKVDERETLEALKHIRFKSKEEYQAHKDNFYNKANERLLAILTPEQNARFQALKGNESTSYAYPEGDESTFEGRFLSKHPDIRKAIVSNEEYIAWKGGLRSVIIDDEQLYLRGGDMLRDEDQIMFEWAWDKGLITQEDLNKDS